MMRTLWSKNNRVAELEITLNGEHTFVAAIPDEKFADLYPIPGPRIREAGGDGEAGD